METTDPRAALVEAANRHRESLAALSRLIGRNEAYLQQFVMRGSPRRLAERDRHVLAAYLGIGESALGGPAVADRPAGVRVPRIDAVATAGAGGLLDGDATLGGESIDPAVIRRLGARAPDLSMIMARGDSMAPTIVDGDEMLVDRGDRTVTARGGIYVIRLAEGLMVKRLTRADGAMVVLSDNPAFIPFTAPEIDIIGRVVRLMRTLK